MPQVDLIDETFVACAPALVAAAVHEPERWRRWWPDRTLTVAQDRGTLGLRWTVRGALVGTSEIWLEPYGDGVLLHYYLRVDPTAGGSSAEPVDVPPRRAARLVRGETARAKRVFWALKDELEAGRPPGTAAVPEPAGPARPAEPTGAAGPAGPAAVKPTG